MTAFFSALGFLTILPVPGRAASPSQLSFSRAFFPLVGLLLGLGLSGLDWALSRVLPVGLTSALLVVTLVVVTRALHLDGLMDTCDGVFGGSTRERRLEIMKDSHVGAFAVAGAVCVLLLEWMALTSLEVPGRPWAIILFPVLSRWAMVVALSAFPYARDRGLGTPFATQSGTVAMIVAGIAAGVIAVLFGSIGGLVLTLAVSLFAWLLGQFLTRALGGLTGDTYGAINELTSALVLVLAVAIAPRGWLWPVWSY